ncbi:MAG: methyltransferase domain-containing protein [Rickettsiales bacterium]
MHKCINCGSKKLIKIPAFIAEFLLDRMKISGSNKSNINKCANCGFIFGDFRPSDIDLGIFYEDYFGEEYKNHRKKFEPEFSIEQKNRFSTDQENQRKIHNLQHVLKAKNLNFSNGKVLDFGGGDGKNLNIELFLNAEKFIFEITQEKLQQNIKNISNQTPIETFEKFDLVISQHCLEHVSYPNIIVNKIYNMIKKGGYFFIEVPYYGGYSSYNSKNNENFASIFSPKRIFLSKISKKYRDNLSKRLAQKIKPFRIHEHLNHFNHPSIKYLLKQSGFVEISTYEFPIDNGKVLCAIAKKI